MRWWRNRSELDFSAEIRAHIELETERLRAEGLSEDAARAQARRSFGNISQSEERFYERNRLIWLDRLKQDSVVALRQLARQKTFSLITIATLALGIGSATAIFTLVHATLLRALPFQQAERIVKIEDKRVEGQSTAGLVGVPRFFDLETRTKSFDALACFFFDDVTIVTGSSLPETAGSVSVTGRFWDIVGAHMLLGRTFGSSDDKPGAPKVAVISYSAWQRLFHGDRNILNRPAKMGGELVTIVGVLAPGAQFPLNRIEVWQPARLDAAQWTWRGEGTRFANVIGRVRKGVSWQIAQRELWQVGEQLRRQYPGTDGAWQFSGKSLRDDLYGSSKPALLSLLAASGVLLLIACVNVANLVLSRGTTREREIALRRALGAAQSHIVVQLLTESVILAGLGGVIGLLSSSLVLRFLHAHLPGRFAATDLHLSAPVVAFAVVVSFATGLLFGLAPALQKGRAHLNPSLKRGDARVAGGRLPGIFVSMEVALSLVLLVGASLLAESVYHLLKSPLGFQPDSVLTLELKLPWSENPQHSLHFFREVQHRIETLPGVIAVGQISALPTADWHLRTNFDCDWRPRTDHFDSVNVEIRSLYGNYPEAMTIPLKAGRAFTESDIGLKKTPVLVNQQFANLFAPGANLMGRHLINDHEQFEIIGILGDVRGTAGSLATNIGAEVYFPAEGDIVKRSIVVRSKIPPQQLIRAIRLIVQKVDPEQSVQEVKTFEQRLSEAVAEPRFNMELLIAFAVMALSLACIGIYGVVSYAVSQRTLEIGIRMALGATRTEVALLFVRRVFSATMLGLLVGVAITLLTTRVIRSQLYGVQPDHPLTFVLAGITLLAAGFIASLAPAVRATGLSPVDALRNE